jgi:hypothetical protein
MMVCPVALRVCYDSVPVTDVQLHKPCSCCQGWVRVRVFPSCSCRLLTLRCTSTSTVAAFEMPAVFWGAASCCVLCGRRWGDSPLRYVQNKLFLNYTAETRMLDFVEYYHDKVICRQWAVNECRPVSLELERLYNGHHLLMVSLCRPFADTAPSRR